MIYIENGNYVFENEFDTAIPFTMRENTENDNDVDYEVYEELFSFTEKFALEYKSCEFSDNALNAIWTVAYPYAEARGYLPPPKKHRCWYYRYIFDGNCELNLNKILPTTTILTAEDALEYINRTTYDFNPELSAGDNAVTIINGEIVSVCAINSSSEDYNRPELCVETVPEMRGRGLAASNICRMVQELLKEGMEAEYRCSQKNIASIKAAMSAGFRNVGRLYYYVCYKKEKINGI